MIRIYGKKNCPKCEAAKAKLDLLNQPYIFYDITDSFPGWRETLAVEARAFYEDTVDVKPQDALPLLEIDKTIYTYAAAMGLLRLRRNKITKS